MILIEKASIDDAVKLVKRSLNNYSIIVNVLLK
jgi:hypothetical protein